MLNGEDNENVEYTQRRATATGENCPFWNISSPIFQFRAFVRKNNEICVRFIYSENIQVYFLPNNAQQEVNLLPSSSDPEASDITNTNSILSHWGKSQLQSLTSEWPAFHFFLIFNKSSPYQFTLRLPSALTICPWAPCGLQRKGTTSCAGSISKIWSTGQFTP